MGKDFDTDRVLKPIKRYLSKDGMAMGRIGIHLWRWGSGAGIAWLAVRPQVDVQGVSKEELQSIMAVHEAHCEEVVADAREQIKELNRRIDMLLRQRWNTPPRGGEGLMRKENE